MKLAHLIERLPFLFALLAIFLFYAFGWHHLTKFETVDEHFWKYERIPEYWQAWQEGRWKKTAINDKPGITVALVAGPGLLFADPRDHRVREAEATRDGSLTVYRAELTEKINRSLRLPILFVNGLVLFFFYFALRSTLKRPWIASFTVILTALSPILLGISQILNPDALLWSFGAAAFFAYLALVKTAEKKFIIWTSFFTGLALLSKYTANILFFWFLLMLFGHYLFQAPQLVAHPGTKKFFLFHTGALLGILLGALLLFTLFLPAVWQKPELLWEGTVGFWQTQGLLLPLLIATGTFLVELFLFSGKHLERIALALYPYLRHLLLAGLLVSLLFSGFVLFNGMLGEPFLAVEQARATATEDGQFLFPSLAHLSLGWRALAWLAVEGAPLLFSLSPLVLIGIFILWFKPFSRYKLEEFTPAVAALTLLPVVYLAALLLSGVLANARYSILLYPVFAFLAAVGIHEGLRIFSEKSQGSWYAVTALVLVLLSSWSVFSARPFYFNYTNSLLPHPKHIHNAWGYGLYEAAEVINSLQEKEEKTLYIWSDRNGLCQFLKKARCLSGYRLETEKTPPRYFVISKRGLERGYLPRDKRTMAPFYLPEHVSELQKNALWRLDILDRPDNFLVIVPAF